MEVLKHGDTYREVECPKCDALFSYCKSDIKIDNKKDYYSETWIHIYKEYITCPECKTMIKLKYLINGEEQSL